ncbi:YeiH family protein [Neisseriaceae bacterium TC5R-5]|nr:YeiH family protein [Neisseriaceae bacterium TC5R-5]
MLPLSEKLPGVLLALVLALLSLYLAGLPVLQSSGLSGLTIAIVCGLVLGNSLYRFIAKPCHAGITFSKQFLLRAGIILFGFKLTFQDIAAVGGAGILIDVLVLSSTFFLAIWLGRKYFGLDEQTCILIGAGSSICGAAAVLATEPVIKAQAEQVTVAVATVVIFGTVAMFVWPLFYPFLHRLGVSEFHYGVFAGSTIHEVAQAVAAGKSVSDQAMNTAVITKMLRVMMLAPFLLLLSAWLARKHSGGQNRQKNRLTIPWFALVFLLVAGFNSFNVLQHPLVQMIISLDNLLLAMAMAALGIGTHFSTIRQAGKKPILLAMVLFAWLLLGGGLINLLVGLCSH